MSSSSIYIRDRYEGPYAVYSANSNETVSTMKTGTQGECRTFVRNRIRSGQPTHFLHVGRNTNEAARRFRRRWFGG